jgi:hypothetical protein
MAGCDFVYDEIGKMRCQETMQEIVIFDHADGWFCSACCPDAKSKISNADSLIMRINNFAELMYKQHKGEQRRRSD